MLRLGQCRLLCNSAVAVWCEVGGAAAVRSSRHAAAAMVMCQELQLRASRYIAFACSCAYRLKHLCAARRFACRGLTHLLLHTLLLCVPAHFTSPNTL